VAHEPRGTAPRGEQSVEVAGGPIDVCGRDDAGQFAQNLVDGSQLGRDDHITPRGEPSDEFGGGQRPVLVQVDEVDRPTGNPPDVGGPSW